MSPKIRPEKIVKRIMPSLYVLNSFKYFLMYILGQNVAKSRQKKL